jgi:sugar phosphate isomerase/epimerase
MKEALRSALDDAGFTITSLDVNDGNNDPDEDRNRERNHTTSQEIQSDHPEFSLELQA